MAAFNLAITAEALDTIQELNDQNVGGESGHGPPPHSSHREDLIIQVLIKLDVV